MKCMICQSKETEHFNTLDKKAYWKCDGCHGIFLDSIHHLQNNAEKVRYLEHNNLVDDPRYRKFLSKLAVPLKTKLASGSEGLDYGCGPGPALADMLTLDGFKLNLYDPFFFPDQEALIKSYQFIVCTETAEHFYKPFEEFNKLDALLLPGGWLGVMTTFLSSSDDFESWYYRRDPTHVCFYSEETLQIIADQRGWSLEIPAKDIALFQKKAL